MAVLPIRITGDPVLHAPAAAVTEFDTSTEAEVTLPPSLRSTVSRSRWRWRRTTPR